MRVPVALVIFVAIVLVSGAGQAMEIRQFDKMADQDQVDYIHGLIDGAESPDRCGQTALAARVEQLFTTKHIGDNATMGIIEFERNLAIVRAEASEVEDVMIITLENNHIELPDSFYDVNKNFRPKVPPKG